MYMYLFMYILYTVYLLIFADDRETFRYYTYLYTPIVIIYIYMHCNYRMALHSNIDLLDVKKVDVGLSTAHSAEKGCRKRQRFKKKMVTIKATLRKRLKRKKEVSLYRKLFDSSFF